MKYDEGLEEIWRIKREIASEYASLDAYFKGMSDYQDDLKRDGVKFVPLPPNRFPALDRSESFCVAEDGAEYDPSPSTPTPAP